MVYAVCNGKRLVESGPTALYSEFRIETSSEKKSESIGHRHVASLMYKILNSSFGQNDLSIGFESSSARRQGELSKGAGNPLAIKIRRSFHIRIYSKDVFGFVEPQ